LSTRLLEYDSNNSNSNSNNNISNNNNIHNDNNFFMVFTRTSSARHRLRLTQANFIYEYFAKDSLGRNGLTYVNVCGMHRYTYVYTDIHKYVLTRKKKPNIRSILAINFAPLLIFYSIPISIYSHSNSKYKCCQFQLNSLFN